MSRIRPCDEADGSQCNRTNKGDETSMNPSHPTYPVHYRERSTEPSQKKVHVISVRVDDDAYQKLIRLRTLLASRIGVRQITMSAALAFCITSASTD